MNAGWDVNVPRFLTYNRVSTEGQVDGTSLDWQREQQVAWGRREGWEHVEDVFDGGQSGAKLDRAGLHRTLALLKDGRVDIVSFYKVDRAARAQRVFEDLWTAIYALDGRVFIHQKAKLYGSLDELMDDTVWDRAMAEKERYSILSRSNEGLEQHLKAGSFLFTAIYGYFTVKERRDGVNANALRIDNEQARIIRIIVDRTIAGQSYGTIAAFLNERGYLTKRRVPWSYSSIQNVLLHRTQYAGVAFTKTRKVRGKAVPITYRYPAILSAGTLERLERAIKLKPTGRGKAAPLRGSVKCAHCGAVGLVVRAHPGGKLQHHAIYCSTRRKALVLRREGQAVTFEECGHAVSAGVVGEKLLVWLRAGGYESALRSLQAQLMFLEARHLQRVRELERATVEREALEEKLDSVAGMDLVRVARSLETQLAAAESRQEDAARHVRAWEGQRELAGARMASLPATGAPLIAALEAYDRDLMNELLHRMALTVWVDFHEPARDARWDGIRVTLEVPVVPDGADYEGYTVQLP